MTTKLVPASEWVYNLYAVQFFTKDPMAGGQYIKTIFLASSNENHLETDANEHAPSNCEYIHWNVVKEDVGHPRVIGNVYGVPIYEDSLTFGKRLSLRGSFSAVRENIVDNIYPNCYNKTSQQGVTHGNSQS